MSQNRLIVFRAAIKYPPRIIYISSQLFFFFTVVDMIAIPGFAHGGMENWGLIIYSEATLLYKPGESSESTKKSVAGVVSHELAHQVCWNIQKKVNILFFYLFLLLLQEERRIRADKKIVIVFTF